LILLAAKHAVAFFLIITGFMLIILIPRDMVMVKVSDYEAKAEYPISMALYKERISGFIDQLVTQQGFGETRYGEPVTQEVERTLTRSMKIVVPAVILSFVFGVFFGIVRFYWRHKLGGKIHEVFSWIFSSIPDFFLYIICQFLLTKLIRGGFPHFYLFGDEHWYSFIMPSLALSVFPFVHLTKYTYASLQNESAQEYVRTAFAKGLSNVQVIVHMLWNFLHGLLNQFQVVLLYIFSSLPIIEKLSSYKGAGYNLIECIQGSEAMGSLAYIIPFVFCMSVTILVCQTVKNHFMAKKGAEL
jgi:oligopeptide transport system permease protein